MYRNPWSGYNDSPVNYAAPAVDIVANSCRHAVGKLTSKLRIYDLDIIEDIVSYAYIYAIRSIANWDTSYPFYNHCWQAVRSVYPEVLRKYRSHEQIASDEQVESVNSIPVYSNPCKSEEEEVEDDIALALDAGVTPQFGSYAEYRKHYRINAIRNLARHRSGTPQNLS